MEVTLSGLELETALNTNDLPDPKRELVGHTRRQSDKMHDLLHPSGNWTMSLEKAQLNKEALFPIKLTKEEAEDVLARIETIRENSTVTAYGGRVLRSVADKIKAAMGVELAEREAAKAAKKAAPVLASATPPPVDEPAIKAEE